MYGISGTMPYGVNSSMGLLSDMNGLVGTNSAYGGFNTGYYGGFYGNGVTDVTGAKTAIGNQYDVYATQQSYGNRQNVENMSMSQVSNTVAMLLREGRGHDAAKQFDVLVNELRSAPQYSSYSDTQLRAIACQVYQQSTGEDLVGAIQNTTPGSFTKGLMEGVPIIGTFFTDGTTKENLTAKTTGMPERVQDQVAETAGAAVSGAVVTGAVGAGIGLLALKGASIGTLTGGPAGAAIGAIAGAIIGGVIAIGKSLTK